MASETVGVAPELAAERAAASFPVRLLTHYLDGSEAATATRERLQAIAENDPVFKKSFADYSRPRPERYRRAMAKQRRLLALTAELNLKPEEIPILRGAIGDDLGTDLQTLMFLPNIKATFAEDQCGRRASNHHVSPAPEAPAPSFRDSTHPDAASRVLGWRTGCRARRRGR